MSKKDNTAKTKQPKKKLKTSSKVLYGAAIVVILIPVLLLGYIYLGAKENSGKPVVGSRFDNALNPAITEEQQKSIESAMKFDGIDSVEVNLKSATLRINLDVKDNYDGDDISSVLKTAYDKVNKILPVKTYFTNKEDGTKMYDLDIHAYNFVPDDTRSEDDLIHKELTKNAANAKTVTDTLTSPRDSDVADDLLKQQEDQKKDNK